MKLARCVDLLISLVIVPALRVNHIHQDLQKSLAPSIRVPIVLYCAHVISERLFFKTSGSRY